MPLSIAGPRPGSLPSPGARLDPTHPLTSGLIVCCPTPWYDIARFNQISKPGGAVPLGSHSLGIGGALNGTVYFDMSDEGFLHSLTAFTVVCFGSATTTTLMMVFRDATGGSNWGIALFIDTTNGVSFKVLGAGGLYNAVGGTVVAAKTHMAAGTFEEGAAIAYLDGQEVARDTTANGAYTDNAALPFSLGRSPLVGGGATGTLGPVMIWNRALTPGDIGHLRTFPFCMVAST